MSSLLNMSGGSLLGKSDSYIDWLKSLGCICWLPLSEEGDLLDRISGKSLELTGNGSMVWNSTYNMYEVTTPYNINKYVAHLDNGMTANNFPNNCTTALTSYRRYTGSANSLAAACQLNVMTSDRKAANVLSPTYRGTNKQSVYPDRVVKLGLYNGTDERIYYNDGDIYLQATCYTPWLPQSWNLTSSGIYIGLPREANNSYRTQKFYLQQAYVFNKKLTLAQVRKIQGYE